MSKDNCKFEFVALLSDLQQVPIVNSGATGKAVAYLSGERKLKVQGSFKNLEGKFISANIHSEIAGRNGQIIFPLNVKLSTKGQKGSFDENFILSDNQVRTLLDRELYINMCSNKYPYGEIRGQLLYKAEKYFIANLSGQNELPVPVNTNATGTIVYEFIDNKLTASGSFSNLSSPIATEILGGAHIHHAATGDPGPVIFRVLLDSSDDNLSARILSQNNVFTLTCQQQKFLRSETLDTDIHSENYLTGEIRSQIVKL